MLRMNYSPMTLDQMIDYLWQMLEETDKDIAELKSRELTPTDETLLVVYENHRDFILSALDTLEYLTLY